MQARMFMSSVVCSYGSEGANVRGMGPLMESARPLEWYGHLCMLSEPRGARVAAYGPGTL